MGDTYQVTAEGFRDLIEGITAIEADFKGPGLNRLATQVGAALLNRIRTRFLATTDPDGKEWVESAAARRRKRTGRDGKTLFDTGTLWNSIQLGRAAGGEVSIGTDVPYARQHQFGEEGNPVRVFLGFGQDDAQFAESVVQKRIDEILRLNKGKT